MVSMVKRAAVHRTDGQFEFLFPEKEEGEGEGETGRACRCLAAFTGPMDALWWYVPRTDEDFSVR